MMTNSQQCKPTSCQGPVAAVQCKDVQATILLPLFASPDRSTCAAVLEVVQASPQEPQFLHLAGAASKALAVRRPAGVDLAGSASCRGRRVLHSLSWWLAVQPGWQGPIPERVAVGALLRCPTGLDAQAWTGRPRVSACLQSFGIFTCCQELVTRQLALYALLQVRHCPDFAFFLLGRGSCIL